MFFLAVMLSTIQPIMFTRSRSTYVGFCVGLLALTVLTRNPVLIMSLIVAPIVAISVFPQVVISRFMSIFIALTDASLTPSWQARLEAWQQFIPHAIQYPFLGRGLFFVPLGFIDNEYVLRAVQTGFIGLLAFLWLFYRFGRTAFDLYWNSNNSLDRKLGLGYLTALISLAVHALAATSFTTIRTAEPLYFFSGLVIACFLCRYEIQSEHTRLDLQQRYRMINSTTSGSHPVAR